MHWAFSGRSNFPILPNVPHLITEEEQEVEDKGKFKRNSLFFLSNTATGNLLV